MGREQNVVDIIVLLHAMSLSLLSNVTVCVCFVDCMNIFCNFCLLVLFVWGKNEMYELL